MIVVLFHSVSTNIKTMVVSKPSYSSYNDLQDSYSSTLSCPCSSMAIPYDRFLFVAPIFHQVCSSDLVGSAWIQMLQRLLSAPDIMAADWRSVGYSQFQMLSTLCQHARGIVDDTIRRFVKQSFVTSNLLTETIFTAQLTATLNQLFQSTAISYARPLTLTRLVHQADQPLMGTTRGIGSYFNAELIINGTANSSSSTGPLKVGSLPCLILEKQSSKTKKMSSH